MIQSNKFMHNFGAFMRPCRAKMTTLSLATLFALSGLHSTEALSAPSYTLEQVMNIAVEQNPLMNIAKAREESATASVLTARAFSNPYLELGAGPTRYRTPGGQGGDGNWGVALSQPLEFPGVRKARRDIAESNVEVATLGTNVTRIDLRVRVKSAFYDVLQRQAVLKLAEENRNLLSDIRERIKLRVDTGESPRYELIKADTEALAAERDYQSAIVRINEGKAYLRGLIGGAVPEEFILSGELPLANTLPRIDELREKIEETPQLLQIRAAIKASEANVRLQEQLRNPGLTIRAGIEQDPDLRQFRLGVAIPLPLWDRRRGQIGEALAEVKEVQAILGDRELGIKREMESAYQRYLIAEKQVAAFEDGILDQAEAVLKVAEAGYRYGERGILEYLDAQRTNRMVRKDYFAARYDYINSMLEIERLLGNELLEVTP